MIQFIFVIIFGLNTVYSTRVAVVGGGFAGLSAASTLEKHGIEYTVLEGTNRIGGRVYPTAYGNGFLEFGAEFINGKENDIYRIAKKLNLIESYVSDFDMFEGNITYGMGGIQPKTDELNEWMKFVGPIEGQMEQEALQFPDMSVAENFQNKYNQWISDGHGDKQTLYDSLASLYRSYYEIEWSSPVNELALLNFDQWDDGTNETASFYLNKNGFHAILEEIKSVIPSSKIKLNSTVTRIDYGGDDIRIELESGEELSFDYAIITCPLGHLKKYAKFLFKPKLPKEKSDAIKYLGFGNMMKIFLEYETPWWPSNSSSIITLRVKGNLPKNKLRDTLKVFQPLSWNNKILVAWVAGQGPQLLSKLTDDEVIEEITAHLTETLTDIVVPVPKKILRHDWYSNIFAHGSYSYLTPISVVKLKNVFDQMASPIIKKGRPILCFAGEHTHSTMYQTTIGAYESGNREALRILSNINDSTDKKPGSDRKQ